MSQQSEDLTRQLLSAFQDRDLDRFLAVLDPEVEVIPIVGSELAATVYRGHEGVRDWWDRMFTVFEEVEVSLDEVRDFGDHAIAVSRFHHLGDESGARPDLVVWAVNEVRNDKIVRWRSFRTEAEALDAMRD
jgi:ketosteroid isomerase-like protein